MVLPFEELTYLFNCTLDNRGIVRLDFNEAALLYKYVKKCKGSVLEVGRMFGGSAILMAAALKEGQRIHTIDMVNTEESISNINAAPIEIKNRINVITGLSANIAEKWQEKLSLIFLDGGHSFPVLLEDTKNWSPFIELNGYMIFHDIGGAGKYLKLEPIIQDMKDSQKWIEFDSVNSMVVLKKIA